MSRWTEGGTATLAAAALGGCLLLAAADCTAARPAPRSQHPAARSQDRTVLVRGQLPGGLGWQLVAYEEGGHLGLDLESPSGYGYSGQLSFAASHDYSYYWGQGLGPGNSIFYYGPVPGSAVMVRLSTPGRPPVLVRTASFPAGHSLPVARYFVIRPPGASTLNWAVTPLDAAGHRVAFSNF